MIKAVSHSTTLEIIRGSVAILANMANMEGEKECFLWKLKKLGSQELYEKNHIVEKLVSTLTELHADSQVDAARKFTALDPGNSTENPPKSQLPFLQYKFNTSILLTIDMILKTLEDFITSNGKISFFTFLNLASVVNILREKQAFVPVTNLLFYEMLSNRTGKEYFRILI